MKSSIYNKTQQVQLEILIELDRICRANNIAYQLFGGTLLGAIRHHGFIPWDDDIDVSMLRTDYEKFQEISKADLKANYFLQNYSTDPNFFRQFSRLRKNNTRYLQRVYKDIDMHHGIFIDIFPLDNVMVNSLVEALRIKLLSALATIDTIRNLDVLRKYNIFIRLVGKIIKLSNVFIKKSLYEKMVTKIMKLFNKKESGYINHLSNRPSKVKFRRYLMTTEDFYDMIDWEFEGKKFPVPRNYDKRLSSMYGDYMQLPPIEEQRPHHGIIEIKL